VVAPGGLYFAAASASTLQIGYRYILPALLFALPLVAGTLRTWPRARWSRLGLALLVVWAGAEAALALPDSLAYVNELGGGVDNGWRLFADMNVDWGQGLVALARYQQAHPDEDLRLAYFGSAYPAAYGVQARLLPGFSRALAGPEVAGFNPYTPPPGTYAISATNLHLGLVYRRQDLYAFFRQRSPDARVGRSLLIYHVDYPPGTMVERAVVVGPEVSSLTPEELGLQPGHRLVTKWAGSGAFVLAAGGPARYLISAAPADSPLISALLVNGPLADARPLPGPDSHLRHPYLARRDGSEPARRVSGRAGAGRMDGLGRAGHPWRDSDCHHLLAHRRAAGPAAGRLRPPAGGGWTAGGAVGRLARGH
jgi:hypothetical protein